VLPSLDIFKIDPGHGVLWRGAVKSLVAANARIRMLALSSPGEYLVLDEDTGQRILVNGLRGVPSNPPSDGWRTPGY
jgi:uncharacterized protein (AIM24 family)